MDNVLRTGNNHGGNKHDHAPEDDGTDELAFMLGEQEEGQSHDAVDLDKGAERQEEGSPEVFFFLYQTECQEYDGGNRNVELLHLDAVEQFVGTEPTDKHLLVFGEYIMTDGKIKKQRQ